MTRMINSRNTSSPFSPSFIQSLKTHVRVSHDQGLGPPLEKKVFDLRPFLQQGSIDEIFVHAFHELEHNLLKLSWTQKR